MKRILPLLILLVVSVSLSAQTAIMEQRTLLTKKTATWCPNCGTWGWTFMKDIIQDNSSKAVIVGAHYSGDLQTPAANELVGIFGGSGQPLFYADNENLRVSRTNIAQKRTSTKALVDANFANTPVANTGLEVFDRSGDLDINAQVEFFESTEGTFNLGILILENDVIANQSSQGPNAMHPFVVRSSVNGVVGDEIATGMISAGTIKDFSYTITPDPEWDVDNLSFAAVIWKENGGSQDFVNVFSVDDIEISTSSIDQVNTESFTLAPSILVNMSNVEFTLSRAENVTIKVMDILGKEVMNPIKRIFPAGKNEVQLHREAFNGKGMYLVTLERGGQITSKRLLVE